VGKVTKNTIGLKGISGIETPTAIRFVCVASLIIVGLGEEKQFN
jgi:hypothetical protein